MTRNRPLDPALLRGMTMPRISRRDALRGGALLSASAFLAACGVQGTSGDDAPQESGFWASQTKAGQLDFANWPLYMDTAKVGGKNVHPSLQAFTKETGIKVNYKEAIEDNDSFLGKINPSLQAGQDPGWDLIVITDGGSIEKLIRQSFLTELDHSKLPNFAKNAATAVKNPAYDPGNKYTLAWQSGLVGLAYNPKLTKREITSYQDLFDPAFKGKITMFGDDTDFPTMGLIALGIDPAKSTEEDWKRAAEWMKKLKPQLREFVDNSGMADVPQLGQRLDLPGLLGRHLPAQHRGLARHQVRDPQGGGHRSGPTTWRSPRTPSTPLDAITSWTTCTGRRWRPSWSSASPTSPRCRRPRSSSRPRRPRRRARTGRRSRTWSRAR